MKRWPRMPFVGMALLCCTATLTSLQANAQAGDSEHSAHAKRPFPPSAVRAVMVVVAPPDVLINGQPGRLAPGARIRNVDNLDVLSGSLVNQPLVVNYTRDNMGQVREVWLLTSAEAAEKRQARQAAPSDPLLRYDQLPAFK